jgi:hypothetical protein
LLLLLLLLLLLPLLPLPLLLTQPLYPVLSLYFFSLRPLFRARAINHPESSPLKEAAIGFEKKRKWRLPRFKKIETFFFTSSAEAAEGSLGLRPALTGSRRRI